MNNNLVLEYEGGSITIVDESIDYNFTTNTQENSLLQGNDTDEGFINDNAPGTMIDGSKTSNKRC